jgi:hypothetical protein
LPLAGVLVPLCTIYSADEAVGAHSVCTATAFGVALLMCIIFDEVDKVFSGLLPPSSSVLCAVGLVDSDIGAHRKGQRSRDGCWLEVGQVIGCVFGVGVMRLVVFPTIVAVHALAPDSVAWATPVVVLSLAAVVLLRVRQINEETAGRGWKPPIPLQSAEVGVLKPAVAALVSTLATTACGVQLDQLLGDDAEAAQFAETAAAPVLQRCGWCLLVYFVLVFLTRAYERGYSALYDVVWGCSQALVLAAIGCITGRPILIGGALTIVATDQTLWIVDTACFMVSGTCPLGVAEYLWISSASQPRTLLGTVNTFHHVWFIPAAIAALHPVGMPQNSLLFCVGTTPLLCVLGRALTPYTIVASLNRPKKPPTRRSRSDRSPSSSSRRSSSRTRTDEEEEEDPQYMNLNLSYAMWKDVAFPPLCVLDFAPWYCYLPFIVPLMNLINVPASLLVGWTADAIHQQWAQRIAEAL